VSVQLQYAEMLTGRDDETGAGARPIGNVDGFVQLGIRLSQRHAPVYRFQLEVDLMEVEKVRSN